MSDEVMWDCLEGEQEVFQVRLRPKTELLSSRLPLSNLLSHFKSVLTLGTKQGLENGPINHALGNRLL